MRHGRTAAVFVGYNSHGTSEIWRTDGTSAGTVQITDITYSPTGNLFPNSIVPFGNQLVFQGYDANAVNQLWITDSSAAGAHQLTANSGAQNSGPSYGSLCVLGSTVLFDSTDEYGNHELWSTNGTAAGTQEFSSQVSGLTSPMELTTFGDQVLFEGLDSSGQEGLWITNGSAGDTEELTSGINNGTWHVELAQHDVILAERLPCESYLDTGNRGAFANGCGPVHLHPEFGCHMWEAQGCAPLVVTGATFEAARQLLNAVDHSVRAFQPPPRTLYNVTRLVC